MSSNNETFIINDIEMAINPSDIQVMDDNWVVEDSFLRSKAVFCYRSKYAATKVVLNIPFQISFLTEEDKTQLNNTYNCIKLVSELNSYPFCFIQNNRIKAYISPSTTSATDFMMFAVDEIALVQDASASNMVFLEIVLQYYNHAPLVRDFEFRSDLALNYDIGSVSNEVTLADASATASEGDFGNYTTAESVVTSLQSSEIWKQYMNPRVKKVLENLTSSGLLDYTSKDKTVHPMMGVQLFAPNMAVIAEGVSNVDDGRYVGAGTKVITVSDTSKFDDGSFENLLATLSTQDFGFEAPKYDNNDQYNTINSENRIKEGSLRKKAKEDNTVDNPFATEEDNKQTDNIDKLKSTIPKGTKDVYIDWVGTDLKNLAISIQKIEIRKKNKLVTHQIGSYKHPIIQYMGKYPLTLNMNIASTNYEIYQSDEPPANTFIKQVLNVLDYNRVVHPEAEAYNYLKIKSLATFLFDCESFLPGQSLIAASSSNQGVENIVYSFSEGDLTPFLDDMKVEASGANDSDNIQKDTTTIITQWLIGFSRELSNILNSSSGASTLTNTHNLSIYKSCIELIRQVLIEMSMGDSEQAKAIDTALKFSSDLKPATNITREYIKITNKYNSLSSFRLYRESSNVNVSTNFSLVSGSMKSNRETSNGKTAKLTSLYYHHSLIPFLVYMLNARSGIVSGQNIKIENVSFRPSGRFNNLALTIISKIDSGIKEGAVVNEEVFSQEKVQGVVSNLADTYSKSFFGYNIEDLDLESLSPVVYDKKTDRLIPQVDPFFFIKQQTILDGTEFEKIYEKMYKNENSNPDLLEHLNTVPDDERGEADSTEPPLSVVYRKLKEQDYVAPATNSGIASSYADGGDSIVGFVGPALNNNVKSKNAKKMDKSVSDAIERALAKYGYSNNDAFRRYMYAVLLKESGNVNGKTSGTGAVGLFQFTYGAVKACITNKNTKLEYSSGSRVGYQAKPTTQFVNSVKATSRTDAYLSAQLFIEYYRLQNNSSRSVNGSVSGIYAYIQHNIGEGGLKDVRRVLEQGATRIKDSTRTNIRHQSVNFIGSNDVQTVRNYYNHMLAKISIDNVPDYVKTNKTSSSTTKAANTTVINSQKEAVEKANKIYKDAQKSLADKTSNATIGSNTITGIVTYIVDGDTFDVRDSKTNKTQRVRLYGVDTPESTLQIELYGQQAKTALTNLIKGKQVTVQLQAGVDKYNRKVGITKLKDGTNVSLVMLRNGYGFVATPFVTQGEYNKASLEAQKNQKGIWSYPDKTVSKPRTEAVNLTTKTNAELEAIKKNTNVETFKQSDLAYAKKINANRLNNFVPLASGVKYTISSPYGKLRNRSNGKGTYRHTGIDFAAPKGSTVIAAASGIATIKNNPGGYGKYITIDHGNGFVSLYAHLSATSISSGARVKFGQKIGEVGNTGRSTGPHLHYEVKYNGVPINPFGTKELSLYKEGVSSGQLPNTPSLQTSELSNNPPVLETTRKGVTEENTVFNEDKLAEAIFRNIYKNTNVGLKASIPSIKVYMTIGNENDKFWLDTLKGDVLYYEIKGIKSFHMNCNNDTNPIDTAFLSIADPSYLNTDAFMGLSKLPGVNVNAIGTSEEMQFTNDRIQLKVGNKLQVRLGYGNSPNSLDTVFNGSIVDVENKGQVLNLVCEGFGKELLAELFATNKPVFLNNQSDNITSSSVIGESLLAETIQHFGYSSGFLSDKIRNTTDPEDRFLSPENLSNDYNWFFSFTKASYRSRLFTNVFAPEVEMMDNEFSNYMGWVSNIMAWFTNHMGGYPFAVYKATPWNTMKQMEYRHPNTICKPMIYEDRMTLFFGIKEQMYFKYDLNKGLQMAAASQKSDGVGHDLTNYYNKRRERMEPVSNVHLATTSHNIISNGLRLSSDYATKIKVNYYDSVGAAEDQRPWELESYEAKADDNLYPFDIRAKELTLSGCLGKYSAFLYGTTELKKEAEKMYKGKIILLGNSSIKAGDYIFLDDTEKRMSGLVLVRECYHHFDDRSGFITEIVPGQYVEAANFLYSSLWLNLMCSCKIVSSKMRATIADNFNSDDFSMVTDYLTIIRQAELELDKVQTGFSDTELKVLYGAVVGLSTYLTHSLSKTLGIGAKSSILKFAGTNISGGAAGFSKAFFRIYVKKVDLWLWERMKTKATTQGKAVGNGVLKWIDSKDSKVITTIKNSKQMIGSSVYVEKVKEILNKKKSGIVWKAAKPVLGLTSKATIEAAKITGRILYSGVLAATVANPLALIIDIMFYAAIQYGFAKIEENKLMRQPLLYFPIVKHGKPYTGGMAGVVRNSWLDSKKTEAKRTFAEIQKASAILIGNSDVTNLSNDRPFYLSILSGVVGDGDNVKTAAPIYQTDQYGRTLVVNEKEVVTVKEAARINNSKLASYNSDEEVMKTKLIQKINIGTVGAVYNE